MQTREVDQLGAPAVDPAAQDPDGKNLPAALRQAEEFIAAQQFGKAVPLLQNLKQGDNVANRRRRLLLALSFLETGLPDVAAEELKGAP